MPEIKDHNIRSAYKRFDRRSKETIERFSNGAITKDAVMAIISNDLNTLVSDLPNSPNEKPICQHEECQDEANWNCYLDGDRLFCDDHKVELETELKKFGLKIESYPIN